jgi:hypothetical protein
MKHLRRFTPVVAALVSIAVATGCTTDSSPDSTLRVQNRSDFRIREIRVTSVGNSSWGRNLLDGDILAPDETLVLGIDCGTYDAMLVDEQGAECRVNDLDLCLNDADWIIYNDTCGVFGAAKAARDAAAKANPAGAVSTPDAGSRR